MNISDFSNRQKMTALAVALLIVLNIWRWWPTSVEQMRIESAGYRQEFSIDESTLDKFVLPEAKDVSIKRNLFVPVTARQVSTIPTKVQKKSEIKAVVNNNTALYVDLNTFRLEGVLDNGGKIQAFLSSNDNVYMVYKGDRFADHYIAEKVSLEGILLRDESKGVSKWIALSGE